MPRITHLILILLGEIGFQLDGARLEISDAEGRLEGQASGGAKLELYDWGGHVEVDSFDSTLELRGFRPGSQLLDVLAEGSEVTVEAMASGQLKLEQKGGRLRVLDVEGKMRLAASAGAEVELEAELALDVSGCTLGGDVGRGEPDAPPSVLTLKLDPEAALEVRGM